MELGGAMSRICVRRSGDYGKNRRTPLSPIRPATVTCTTGV